MIRKFPVMVLLALSPIMAVAQTPASSDVRPEAEPRRPLRPPLVVPPERDLEEASAFMREHAPNRWQAIQNLPEDGRWRSSVMTFVIARYRTLQEVKRDDPKIYDIKMSELATEDEVYGLIANLSTPEEREKHREQLRQATRKLLDLNLMERERRIERLKATLASEETKLSSDRSRLDAQVTSRTDALVTEGTPGLRREMFPNRPTPAIRRPEPTTKPAVP